jgi:hypothetical protein
MKIGMNLAAPVYFSRAWVFSNLIEMSRDWVVQGNPNLPVPVFEDGYPDFRQIPEGMSVSTVVFNNADGHYPGGKYFFSFEGKGTFRFSGAVTAQRIIDTNLLELTVDPSRGAIGVVITSSDPTDHLRSFDLYDSNGFNHGFQQRYVQHVSRFNVVRFMDWQGTNLLLAPPELAKRHTPMSVRQRGRGTGKPLPAGEDGVAIEHMVNLCNVANVNPWFCMYHLFNEEYVREFATIVRDRLRPTLKIRLEWSNEAWNANFPVYRWITDQVNTLGVSRQEIVRQEAERNWAIWYDVFKGQENRLIKVISGHNGNPAYARKLLETGISGHELAVAPYVTPKKATTDVYDELTTIDEIFEDINEILPEILSRTSANIALAKQYNLRPVCYEGGQGLMPRLSWRESAWGAQFDPRMRTLYDTLLRELKARGMTLFCHFDDISDQKDPFGSWGASNYQDEDGQKMQALLAARPKRTLLGRLVDKIKTITISN